jgi:hypothetical protein
MEEDFMKHNAIRGARNVLAFYLCVAGFIGAWLVVLSMTQGRLAP